jgi:HNH endonuclease
VAIRPGRCYTGGMDTFTRFLHKVDWTLDDDCWLWLGSKITSPHTGNKYGNFWDGKRNILAHRYAVERERGPIPDGMVVDHLCRQTLCVRPDHLDVVTPAENTRRGMRHILQKAEAAARTHCSRGHLLQTRPSGIHRCRDCENVAQRQRRARR